MKAKDLVTTHKILRLLAKKIQEDNTLKCVYDEISVLRTITFLEHEIAELEAKGETDHD